MQMLQETQSPVQMDEDCQVDQEVWGERTGVWLADYSPVVEARASTTGSSEEVMNPHAKAVEEEWIGAEAKV